MKYDEETVSKVVGMVFIVAFFLGIGVSIIVNCTSNNYPLPRDRNMVSYEYTTQCRCGGTIEGYQSLVDDYNREECNKCGYHKE